MKITDIKVWPTRIAENRSWIFIQIDTDEGITGFGEATNSGGGGVITTNLLTAVLYRGMHTSLSLAARN